MVKRFFLRGVMQLFRFATILGLGLSLAVSEIRAQTLSDARSLRHGNLASR